MGDLSAFRKIAEDTLSLVHDGNLPAAKSRVGDLELAWDNAEAQLRTMNREKWTLVDDSIDDVLRKLRSVHQNAEECSDSLGSLIDVINSLNNEK